jgi:hypothetical protein
MKEVGLVHWLSPNMNATNSSGYTGLPSGLRNNVGGTFFDLGRSGYYWTTSGNPPAILNLLPARMNACRFNNIT